MRLASSGEASSCLKAVGKGRDSGSFSSSGSMVVELFLGVRVVIPSEDSETWLAGVMVDEDEAGGPEARVFLVGAGEKANPPLLMVTRVPETGGAEVFGSLGALDGWSRDSGRVFLFLLAMLKQKGSGKDDEKVKR